MAEQHKIRHDNQDLVSDEDLLRYLDDTTPEEEKIAIEEKILNNSFESEALEGLQQIKRERITTDVSLLNQRLQQHLQIKKLRNNKGKIKDLRWILLTILILLFICIISYIIIRMHSEAFIF